MWRLILKKLFANRVYTFCPLGSHKPLVIETHSVKRILFLIFITVCYQDEKYAHIEEAEMVKVSKKIDEKLKWLNEKMMEYKKTAMHETPKVLPSQILAEKKVQILTIQMKGFLLYDASFFYCSKTLHIRTFDF